MTGDALAELSNNLLYSAMAVYAVAMYCYAAELAFGSPRRRKAVEPQVRELAAVGAAPAYVDESADATDAVAVDEAREARAGRLGRVAVSVTVLAFALHLGSIVARGVSAGRPPWGNMFEFSVTGALAVTGVFLLLLARKDGPLPRHSSSSLPVLLTLGLAVDRALHRVRRSWCPR